MSPLPSAASFPACAAASPAVAVAFARTLAAALLLAAAAALPAGTTRPAAARDATTPPHAVVFLVDDLGWADASVPMTGESPLPSRGFRTPAMERVAAEGLTGTDASAATICSPSRISLMTGLDAARHRVTSRTLHADRPSDRPHLRLEPPAGNVAGPSPVPGVDRAVHAPVLPVLLRDAGDRTIHVGNAHLGAIGTPGEDPLVLGFDVDVAGHAAGAPGSHLGEHHHAAGRRAGDPPRPLEARAPAPPAARAAVRALRPRRGARRDDLARPGPAGRRPAARPRARGAPAGRGRPASHPPRHRRADRLAGHRAEEVARGDGGGGAAPRRRTGGPMMRRVCSRPPFRGRRPAADRGAAALVVLALAAVAGPGGCGPAGDTGDDAAPVRILAAASLTNVLESLAPRLEAAAGRPVSMSFAASSTLARQLMAGAAADVYLSADTAWVDELEVAGLVAERRPLQANRMVLVVPRDSTEPTAAGEDETVRRLLEPRLARIAVADPSAVPAGRHARHALERAGAWTGVEPRLVSAANVRQALAWVEAGEADAGIVYATDAAVSDRVRVIGPLPVDPARPVRGAAALTPEGAARPAARAVWIALADAEATRAFADFGFEVGTADAPAPAHVREAAAP